MSIKIQYISLNCRFSRPRQQWEEEIIKRKAEKICRSIMRLDYIREKYNVGVCKSPVDGRWQVSASEGNPSYVNEVADLCTKIEAINGELIEKFDLISYDVIRIPIV